MLASALVSSPRNHRSVRWWPRPAPGLRRKVGNRLIPPVMRSSGLAASASAHRSSKRFGGGRSAAGAFRSRRPRVRGHRGPVGGHPGASNASPARVAVRASEKARMWPGLAAACRPASTAYPSQHCRSHGSQGFHGSRRFELGGFPRVAPRRDPDPYARGQGSQGSRPYKRGRERADQRAPSKPPSSVSSPSIAPDTM